MPLIHVVVILAIVGLFLWAVGQVPMDATIAKLIRVVVIVAACLWLFDLFFGLGLSSIRVGR